MIDFDRIYHAWIVICQNNDNPQDQIHAAPFMATASKPMEEIDGEDSGKA
jgi:hypothetical protein